MVGPIGPSPLPREPHCLSLALEIVEADARLLQDLLAKSDSHVAGKVIVLSPPHFLLIINSFLTSFPFSSGSRAGEVAPSYGANRGGPWLLLGGVPGQHRVSCLGYC